MLKDIVLDANVLLHAHNKIEVRQKNCVALLNIIMDSDTHLCVDEGFSAEEARNCSQIWHEYIKWLTHGTLGHALIAHLAQTKRVKQLPRSVPNTVSRAINRQINKGVDRIYVRVAFNSKNKILVSHDYQDIPETVRARLRGAIEVQILSAEDTLPLMNE